MLRAFLAQVVLGPLLAEFKDHSKESPLRKHPVQLPQKFLGLLLSECYQHT